MTVPKPTSNPAEPGRIEPGVSCECPDGSCGLHAKGCPAKHLHRFPGTKTITHLDRTHAGLRCPYCQLAETRPDTARTLAALRKPSATADQGDLFDTTPYQVASNRRGEA